MKFIPGCRSPSMRGIPHHPQSAWHLMAAWSRTHTAPHSRTLRTAPHSITGDAAPPALSWTCRSMHARAVKAPYPARMSFTDCRLIQQLCCTSPCLVQPSQQPSHCEHVHRPHGRFFAPYMATAGDLGPTTSEQSVVVLLVFSESVQGLAAASFAVSGPASGASVTGVKLLRGTSSYYHAAISLPSAYYGQVTVSLKVCLTGHELHLQRHGDVACWTFRHDTSVAGTWAIVANAGHPASW